MDAEIFLLAGADLMAAFRYLEFIYYYIKLSCQAFMCQEGKGPGVGQVERFETRPLGRTFQPKRSIELHPFFLTLNSLPFFLYTE